MAEKSGDFGLVGQAWEVSKIYMSSNAVKRYNGVLENSSVKTLSTYVKGFGASEFGIDQDTKADDRLAKYNITKMIPTKNLGEFDNAQEVYVITDETGHDIGTLSMVDGRMEFTLSPKIAESNKKILEAFPEYQRKEFAENYGMDPSTLSSKDMDFKTVVERLAKGETISIMSKEQVKVECKEEIEKAKMEKLAEYGDMYDIETNSNDNVEELEQELQEQQKVMEGIPESMRAEVAEKCKEQGIRVKDVLVVTSPELLTKSIDNRKTQISKDGGPVVLIQAAHDGADSLDDDVYAFQDGGELQHTEENDDKLTAIMEQHKGEGTIVDINNNRAQMMEQAIFAASQEAQLRIEEKEKEIEELQLEMEAEIQFLDGQEFDPESERAEAIAACELKFGNAISDAEQEIEHIGMELSHEIEVIRENSGISFEEQEHDAQMDDGQARTIYDGNGRDPRNSYL